MRSQRFGLRVRALFASSACLLACSDASTPSVVESDSSVAFDAGGDASLRVDAAIDAPWDSGASTDALAGPLYDVPPTIDSTGATETCDALMAWLVTLPPATASAPATVRFAPGGTYWCDHTILLRGDQNPGGLVHAMWPNLPSFALDHYRFDLRGATIEQRLSKPFSINDPTTARVRWGNPIVATMGASDVELFGGTLRGSAPKAVYDPNFEPWQGVLVSTGGRTAVDHVYLHDLSIQNTRSDFVYLVARTSAGDTLSDVRIERNTMKSAGRQGIVLNGGNDVIIRGNDFRDVARHLFDCEPTATDGFSGMTIDGNTGNAGDLGYFNLSAPIKATVERLSITNNTLTFGHFTIDLCSQCSVDPNVRRRGFTMTGNKQSGQGTPYGGATTVQTLVKVRHFDQVSITANEDYFASPSGGVPNDRGVGLADCTNAVAQNNCWHNAVDAQCQ